MYKIIGADQKEYGPVTADQLRQWLAEGRVNAQTLVQGEGQTNWQPLSAFPELAASLPAAPISPAPGAPVFTAAPVPAAAANVQAPATALLVVGILSILGAVLAIVGNLTGATGPAMPNPEWQKVADTMRGPVGIAVGAFHLIVGAFVTYAAVKFRKLESYGLVVTGTILSMLPCTVSWCCCIGLPIGIWVLIVLSKAEVKSAFH